MKNTPMPLDLVFIGEDGRVSDVLQGEPFSEASSHRTSRCDFVLELKAGTAQKAGIRPGDRLHHPRDRCGGRRLTIARALRDRGCHFSSMTASTSPSSTAARVEPVLLIHGFASSFTVNWVSPGWVKTLEDAGYRPIAFDNRGHGASTKSYDPADYTPSKMAGDAAALLDHLGIARAHVMGYSMGARIAAFMALERPARVATLVFGGLGSGMVDGVGDWDDDRRRAAGARPGRNRHRSRAACFAPSPTRPAATAGRWRPASRPRASC